MTCIRHSRALTAAREAWSKWNTTVLAETDHSISQLEAGPWRTSNARFNT